MTTTTRPPAPADSTELDAHNLERLAFVTGYSIDLPPASGGWAVVTSDRGRRFHAWLRGVTP